ncbi:Chromatin modification-related protein Eaf6 [Trypanosoma melophagium]|uniref:Chromatin modification-related protein Eaf6 n=1 Tax=Trypanosoma melophagium TaxID=715481 RepID=UPI00351AA839|nr:Chromatin modification-related protein Eaf6 [Trypanosoma melophagium]
MPPKGYARRAASTAVSAAKRDFTTTGAFGLPGGDDAVALPVQLQQLQQRREALEAHLEAVDLRVYELESVYLRQYVELGGCLFDGFGLERQQQQQWNSPNTSTSPIATTTTMNAATVNTTGIAINNNNNNNNSAGVQAYRARLRGFTPNDRVFTASSVGALGAVERLKTLAAVGGKRKRMRGDA